MFIFFNALSRERQYRREAEIFKEEQHTKLAGKLRTTSVSRNNDASVLVVAEGEKEEGEEEVVM